MTDTTSPVAKPVPGVRNPSGALKQQMWGYLAHTTGGGITAKAKKYGKDPLAVAIEAYIAMQNGSEGYLWGGPHYVIPHDGSIHQLAPDDLMMNHCGGGNRGRYFDGTWRSVFAVATSQWDAKWGPRFKHPYTLFPSRSPNQDYIGVELIPVGDGFGTPMAPGLRFTREQHDACAALGKDLGTRHGWPADWQHSNRFVGHEDVDPLNRADAGGGWDPGYLRAKPYFDFPYVRGKIA